MRTWTETVVTAGLAAVIASAGGYLNEYGRAATTSRDSRCDIAAGMIEDDNLNRVLPPDKQREITYIAMRTLARCLRE